MSDAAPASFLASRGATWLAIVVLVGMAGVVGYSVLDYPKAAAIESFAQTTAAGDTRYFAPPSPPLAVPELIFTWQDRPWAPASDDKLKVADPEMRRVGRDEATGLSIYRPASGKPPGYFVKIAVGEFLRLQPR